MVARGDLGMEIPPSKVFLAQKMMIREANIAGKPIITATQMLESMIGNPRPTRAECSDVANAILDGSDAVMLSGETANGPYFEQAVKVMARTCREVENSRNYNNLYMSIQNTMANRQQVSASDSLASSAVKTAIDVDAKVIIVLSETGNTARNVAKFRPGRHIICLTPDPVVSRQCSGLLNGVHAYVVDSLEGTNAVVKEACIESMEAGIANEGDRMVLICGHTYGKGANDQIKVETISSYEGTSPKSKMKRVSSQPGLMRHGFSFPDYK
jgi:pyruvate kinase